MKTGSSLSIISFLICLFENIEEKNLQLSLMNEKNHFHLI